METLRYVVLVNALLAVVSFAYYVLLRRETFFRTNRLVLWMGIVATLLLPLLELPDWRPQPVRTVMHRTAQVIVPKILSRVGPSKPEVTITFPNQRTYPAFQQKADGIRWSWPMLVLLVYAGVALVLLIRLGVQLNSLRRLIRQSVHESYGDFTLVRNEAVTSPFSFFSWVVLNPDIHASDELEQILRHERVHVRERHSLDMLGAELVCIVFWFNPAAYLFRFLLHQTLEFSADQTVLAEGVDLRAYQYNLVKVSLSAGQSAITNHFSRSQLKSRISMLNKPASPKTTWLKYPVFFIAALTVASAFARPQLKQLSTHLPRPLAADVNALLETPKTTDKQIVEPELSTKSTSATPIPNANDHPIVQNSSVESITVLVDSVSKQVEPESPATGPSRYIFYQGNRMWWIITPLFKFDDFAFLKDELAKHGKILQLIDVRYNWSYTFIEHLDYKLVGVSSGSSSGQRGNGKENTPILASGGFLELGPDAGAKTYLSSTSYAQIPSTAKSLPDEVRKIIIEDETVVNELVKDQKMEPIVQAGINKFVHKLGNRSQVFKHGFFRNTDTHASGITIQPNGGLSINEELKNVKVFINDYESSPESIRIWRANQVDAVVKVWQYDEMKKDSSTTALLIYTTEDN